MIDLFLGIIENRSGLAVTVVVGGEVDVAVVVGGGVAEPPVDRGRPHAADFKEHQHFFPTITCLYW